VCCMEERVAKMEVTSIAHCDLLRVISVSIPLKVEIAISL